MEAGDPGAHDKKGEVSEKNTLHFVNHPILKINIIEEYIN